MKVLALYNLKGGVGKTASAVNLAFTAAQEGSRVLLWDLDPQGAATWYFRVKPRVKGGARRIFRLRRDLGRLIKGTDYENLDLIPADFSYRHNDILLERSKKPTRRMRKLLRPLRDEFDYVFLDCPPSISLVSENIFLAADALLMPIIPTTLSVRSLEQVLAFCRKNGFDRLPILPFFSMTDRRKRMHRDVMGDLPKDIPGVLEAAVPYASEVEQMGSFRAPLGEYAAHSRSQETYEALWAEIRDRLEED